MAAVGVLVRVDAGQGARVERALGALPGVVPVPLEEPGTIGAVLSAESLDAAHALLEERVRRLDGVLCAWPVHVELGEAPAPGGGAPAAGPSDR